MWAYIKSNWRKRFSVLFILGYILFTLIIIFLAPRSGTPLSKFENIVLLSLSSILTMHLLTEKRIFDLEEKSDKRLLEFKENLDTRILNLEEKLLGEIRPPANFYIFDSPKPEDIELLRNAKKIDLLGVNLKKSIENNHTVLAEAISNGATIRVIITDPKGDGFKAALFRSNGENEKLLNENFEYSIEKLHNLRSNTRRKRSIRIKYLKYPPSFALMIVDQRKCFIKIYSHDGVLDGKYPWLVLEPNRDRWWYRYFENQYDILWGEAVDQSQI